MKITIDNLDGQGALDYTSAFVNASPLTIERRLNEPTVCALKLAIGRLSAPASGARVAVNAENGISLFTGYIVAPPEFIYVGMATEGPAYLMQVACMSDEVILDARVNERTAECVSSTAGDLLTKITSRATSQFLPMSGDGLSSLVGGYDVLAGKSWSANVGALSNAARACYRVVNHSLEFHNLGNQSHRFAESDNSLDRQALHSKRVHRSVNDVTVCGPTEPQTYVTEVFQGDGLTSIFELGELPFMEKAMLISDTFQGTTIDSQRWVVVDGGGYLSLTPRGLTLGGGQGGSGNSSVTAVDSVEMGGVILVEVSGLQVDALGEGYVGGFLDGTVNTEGSILTGFHLRASGSEMMAVPIVSGVEAGTAIALQMSHTYTLRLRFHCKDRQRALQTYSSVGSNGAVRIGGQILSADADLVLEIQETTGGVMFEPVVMFDGTLPSIPSQCRPVVIESINFLGSIASFEITRPGDVWVCSSKNGSAITTQRLGASAQLAQANLANSGRLNFYPGSVPEAGTVITANYRLGGRAVARMSTASSSISGSLIVTIEQPLTRSSADCENAALALLPIATWPDGSWKGTYSSWNLQLTADAWPGDLLQIDAPSMNASANLLIRNVRICATSCVPELLQYTIAFANEWAETLSFTITESVPPNTLLPSVALSNSLSLASLRDLSVGAVSTTEIQVQAGDAPPTGGGFEIRRSDGKFGAGDGADLVLRSPVSDFTIIREAPVERYYVRMYDSATPPNYSRFSSAIFVNAAMQ